MATRLYFHDAATGDTGTLPGASTLSTSQASPTLTAATASTNRSMTTTIGASQTSIAITNGADTSVHSGWFRRFLSLPIAAQTIAIAQAPTITMGVSESNTNSNFFPDAGIFVWDPVGGSRRGTLVDAQAWDSSNTTTSEAWFSLINASGADVAASSGDIIVVELYRRSIAQGMASAYTNTVYYDGTTEVSAASAAAYVDFPTTVTFSGAATTSFPPYAPRPMIRNI